MCLLLFHWFQWVGAYRNRLVWGVYTLMLFKRIGFSVSSALWTMICPTKTSLAFWESRTLSSSTGQGGSTLTAPQSTCRPTSSFCHLFNTISTVAVFYGHFINIPSRFYSVTFNLRSFYQCNKNIILILILETQLSNCDYLGLYVG